MWVPLFMDGESFYKWMISGQPHDCGKPQIIHGFSTRTIHGVCYSSIPAARCLFRVIFFNAHLATFFFDETGLTDTSKAILLFFIPATIAVAEDYEARDWWDLTGFFLRNLGDLIGLQWHLAGGHRLQQLQPQTTSTCLGRNIPPKTVPMILAATLTKMDIVLEPQRTRKNPCIPSPKMSCK